MLSIKPIVFDWRFSHLQIDETDPKIAVANSFSIYTGSHCLVVAASSEAEKTKWVEDIQMAIINARRWKEKKIVSYPSLKSNSKYLVLLVWSQIQQ